MIRLRKMLFGFLKKQHKLEQEVSFPLSQTFLKRYKKLNKKAYDISKIKSE